MNRRELASQIFISPRNGGSIPTKAIHETKSWRTRESDMELDLLLESSSSGNDLTNRDAMNRRKRRLREAKQQIIAENVQAQRHRQQLQEQARANNQKILHMLEQRRIFDKQLKEDLANIRQKRHRNRRLKKVIRRRIIKTVLRKSHTFPLDEPSEIELDDEEDMDESSEEELVFLQEEDNEEATTESFEVVEEFEDGEQYGEEEVFEDSQGNLFAILQDDNVDNDNSDDLMEEMSHNEESGEGQEEILEEEIYHEDDDADEELFFAKIRAQNQDDIVSLTESEQLRREEEEFQREQEELFRLAAERQAEEDEDLLWEEEELMREEEARRLAKEENLKKNTSTLSLEERRSLTLQEMILARPALKPSSMKTSKTPTEENVLDREIGYRSPSLLALVNQGKMELRPPPSEEHKQEYQPVVRDAASIARLVRLNEHVIEAQGQRNAKDFNAADCSYSSWEKSHNLRGQNRKPIQNSNRSSTQIMVNEAATLGKLRGARQVNHNEIRLSVLGEIDIDDLGDEKYDGARVFRTEHLIDRYVMSTRKMDSDWTPEYDDKEYRTLDDVELPTPDLPCFIPKSTKKTQQQIREELSRTVAEGYWNRYYRLERPGAKLNVTSGCFCKYCCSANAWQTYAYQKKWADERLPPKELLSDHEDLDKFGYIARLYLPDKSLEDIDFVDLKESDEPTKKDFDLGSVDGTCSVDFSLGSVDLFDESDEEGFSSTPSKQESPKIQGASETSATVAINSQASSKVPTSQFVATGSKEESETSVHDNGVERNCADDEFDVALDSTIPSMDLMHARKSSDEKTRQFKPLRWVKKTMFGGSEKELLNTVETEYPETSPSGTSTLTILEIPPEAQHQPVSEPMVQESYPARPAGSNDASNSRGKTPGEPGLTEQPTTGNGYDSNVQTDVVDNTVETKEDDQIKISATEAHNSELTDETLEPKASQNVPLIVDKTTPDLIRVRRKPGILARLGSKRKSDVDIKPSARLCKDPANDEIETKEESSAVGLCFVTPTPETPDFDGSTKPSVPIEDIVLQGINQYFVSDHPEKVRFEICIPPSWELLADAQYPELMVQESYRPTTGSGYDSDVETVVVNNAGNSRGKTPGELGLTEQPTTGNGYDSNVQTDVVDNTVETKEDDQIKISATEAHNSELTDETLEPKASQNVPLIVDKTTPDPKRVRRKPWILARLGVKRKSMSN